MQSGSLVEEDRLDPSKHNLRLGQRMAEEVGCATANRTLEEKPEEVIGCLRSEFKVMKF